MRKLLLAIVAAAGCHHGVEWEDFRGVCDGTPVAGAAAYVPGAAISPTIMFQKLSDKWRKPMGFIPPEWSSFKDPSRYQVVACVEAKDKRKVQDCHYDQGGYVALYDATLEIRAVEAKTGKLIATKTVMATNDTSNIVSGGCPIVKSSDDAGMQLPDYAGTLQAFLKPLVAK
jgi:hypothetical protein